MSVRADSARRPNASAGTVRRPFTPIGSARRPYTPADSSGHPFTPADSVKHSDPPDDKSVMEITKCDSNENIYIIPEREQIETIPVSEQIEAISVSEQAEVIPVGEQTGVIPVGKPIGIIPAGEPIGILPAGEPIGIHSVHGINHIQTSNEENAKNLIPPDGGWGWVVLFAGFISLMFVTLPPVTFGVLYAPLMQRFQATSTMIAWIFNSQVCICNVITLAVSPLCEEFGWRTIAFIGGVANGMSFILSAFAPCEEFLFFSFSTLGGIGRSFGLSSSIFIVSKYFLKRRGFALGIMTLGACVGGFLGPLLSNFLIERYSFKGACFILGGIVLNQCVAATFYEPIERHLIPDPKDAYKSNIGRPDTFYEVDEVENIDNEFESKKFPARLIKERFTRRLSNASQFSGFTEQSAIAFPPALQNNITEIKSQSKSTCQLIVLVTIRIAKSTVKSLKCLRSVRVIFVAVSAACLRMGFMNFQMWIPFVVRDAGHSLELSAWCLAVASISNAVSRIITSAVADCPRFSVRGAYVTGIFIVAVSIAAFPMSTDFTYLIIWVVIWGFGLGVSMCLYSTSIIDVVGVELFPTAYGVCSLFIALLFIVAGPIIGMLQDFTANYSYTMLILTAITFFGVPLWLLMPLAESFDELREKRRVHIVE